jgi:hypothetical protein
MKGIVDILWVEKDKIGLIMNRYPTSVIKNESGSGIGIQKYYITIPDEDPYEDSYYFFLFDNLIAMCSRNFQARLVEDEQFRERMRARADENLKKALAQNK